MKQEERLDPRLTAMLDELKNAPPRNSIMAARARSRFLDQAVSASEELRRNRWTLFQRKENFAMNLLLSTMIVLGLFFGGSVTMAAAQDDLPNEALYQVRLMSEDAKVWLAPNPEAKIERLMEQAQIHLEEMTKLASQGVNPPAELTARVQDRIREALRLTSELSDEDMLKTLAQIQSRLQLQERLMSQAQDGDCAECAPILQQTQEMLRTQLKQVEDGIVTPDALQNQIRATQTLPTGNGTVTPQETCTPVLSGAGQQEGIGNSDGGEANREHQQTGSTAPVEGTTEPNNDNGQPSGPENGGGGLAPDPIGQGGKP